jgi:hypothetical protein
MEAGGAWRWIYGPRTDLIVALGWVPVFVVAWSVTSDATIGGRDLLAPVVALTLLASAMHQCLTLGLVYADEDQREAHRALFRWAPVAVVGAVVTTTAIAPIVIIVVAALWNTVHTVQQRYGLCRIYSRRGGYGSARLDRVVLYGTLLTAVVAVAASPDLVSLVGRAGLGGRNGRAVAELARIRPYAGWLLVPLVAVVVVSLVATVRQEARAGRAANRAKWVYLGSSVALVASIVVAPAAGFVAYVAGHTIEYVVVVYRTAVRRSGDPTTRGSLGRLGGRPGWVLVAMTVPMAAVGVLHVALPLRLLSVALACMGALHFLYDGVIWKLRRPAVAAEFSIGPVPEPATLTGG